MNGYMVKVSHYILIHQEANLIITFNNMIFAAKCLGNLKLNFKHQNNAQKIFFNTSASLNVTKANARYGFGIKTSVISPYFEKYSRKSSAVRDSGTRPTKTRFDNGLFSSSYKKIFSEHTINSHLRY